MQFPVHLLVITLLAAIVLSGPIPDRTPRSFRVPLVRRTDVSRNALAAMSREYAKFGISRNPVVHSDSGQGDDPLLVSLDRDVVARTVEPNENGAVANMPVEYDVQYLSPVTIGGQEFQINLDTGSADTWVFGNTLKYIPENRTVFHPEKSKTFSEMKGFTFKIRYGDGSYANGPVGLDTVDVGGATVEKQAVGVASVVSRQFINDLDSDGLIGLGFTKLNSIEPEKQNTFFDNLAANLDEPVFTAQLRAGAAGSYEFGRIDASKYTGELFDVPVNASRGFWEITSPMFMVGSDFNDIQTMNTTTTTRETNTAIVDTASTLMIVADQITDAYYAQVQDAWVSGAVGGAWVFPCNATLPPLHLSISDTHMVRVPGELLRYRVAGTHVVTGETVCLGGVQPNHGNLLQIWGTVFLKAVFTVFDRRGPTLRFAAHAENVSGSE